ncbi:hypothetical protein [Rhizobium halophytocola]|uniref:DUF3990 domain-containing protein n=1 Tax=Rhizobium halophytocola TaxID=735519 RepID=A0ABS4DTN1_9HYPH|nr:hypothetical protein [Rhizobium halophytocola]MBP1849058.1 hypothetical protein [Rhizobium halophytocola]
MFFLGYHGTSEAHAFSILQNGVLAEKLSPNGQIGKGFYIAKMNKRLPSWASTIATHEGRKARADAWYSKSYLERVLLYLTGNNNLPVPPEAKKTVLKVYATKPLDDLKWSVMQISTLQMIKLTGGLSAEMENANLPEWLQMVVPPDQVQHLVCTRDDGVVEHSTAWLAREAPAPSARPAGRPQRRLSL